jgi:N-acetylglutamate synthase-like GNAT family acetyltransferase
MTIKLRTLSKKDIIPASKLVGLNYSKEYEKSSKKEIDATFKNKIIAPKYIVAEEEGKLVGFAGFIQSWMDYGIYQIFWVNVEPKHQGKGIGTKLINEIIKRVKNKKGRDKANMILLTTTSPEFYERFGFEQILVITKDKKKNKKEYLMKLTLL